MPAGSSARSYTVMDNGRVRFGIGNDATASGLVCTFRSDAEVTNITPPASSAKQGWNDGKCQSLGPEMGFSFVGYTVEDCAPGSCPAPCVDEDRLPHFPTPPAKLSLTGLYADNDYQGISPRALPYKPAYELWSDGAVKTRHVYIPKCAKVNTSDMDHWSMPVGSRFWKEFQRNSVLVETRLIHRFGPGPDDWIFASYQWPLDQRDRCHAGSRGDRGSERQRHAARHSERSPVQELPHQAQ